MIPNSIFAAFDNALNRLHDALIKHDHLNLAQVDSPILLGNPRAPDLNLTVPDDTQIVNKGSLDRMADKILMHYIPGSKRQCLRYGDSDDFGNSDFISFDGTQVVDPDQVPPAIIYKHLVHFNEPSIGLTFGDDALPLVNNNKQYWVAFSGTISDQPTTGVDNTRRLVLNTIGTSVAKVGSSVSEIPWYQNNSYWSESFVWWPNGSANQGRNIFRHVPYGSRTDHNSGLWMEVIANNVSPNSKRGALKITVRYGTGTNDYASFHVRKADFNSGNGFVDNTRYNLELYFKNGYYFVFINGLEMPLYDANMTTRLDATGVGYNPNPSGNSNIHFDVPAHSVMERIRLFGGISTNGCKGSIDEYAFKYVDATYVPANNPINLDIENNLYGNTVNYIGTSSTASIVFPQTGKLVVSAANPLEELIASLTQIHDYSNVALNNKTYLYFEIQKYPITGIPFVIPKSTLIPPQYDIKFRQNSFAGLFSQRQNIDSVDVDLILDSYGTNWDYDPNNVISVYHANMLGNLTLNGIDLTNTSAFLRSNLLNLNDRWTIQIGFRRNNNALYGTLFETADNTGTLVPGIKVEWLTGNHLSISISTDGVNWVSQVITDAGITNAINDTAGLALVELYYTGFKYGIRVGHGYASGSYIDEWVYGDSTDGSGIRTPVWLNLGTTDPVVFASGGALTVGDGAAAIPNCEVLSFNVLPYMLKDHPTHGLGRPNIYVVGYVDNDILLFNKPLMQNRFINGVADSINSQPPFANSDWPMVFVGEITADQGGIVDAISYNYNARFESDWMLVNAGSPPLSILHMIGDSDLDVEVFLNTVPENEGSWKDAGMSWNATGSHTYGIGISNINQTSLKLTVGDTSITNLGSAPTPGVAVTQGYIKVVVNRSW